MKAYLKCILILSLFTVTYAVEGMMVTNVAQGCASKHSLFLMSDGSLWGMGRNNNGQLGDGFEPFSTDGSPPYYGTNKPEEIVSSGVTAITVGSAHSLFVKTDGSLWAMGYNGFGQLGNGTYNSTNRPQKIVSSGVTAVAAGSLFSLFLKSDGSLWAMGYNYNGQLGDGALGSGTNRPAEIVSNGVTAIAAGGSHSLFLKSDGSLWAMGDNHYGQLGDGSYGDSAFNNSINYPKRIVADGVIAIAAGGAHSLFIKSDGSLWTMGYNFYGQLGDGTYNRTNQPKKVVESGVIAITAGGNQSLFLKIDGSLWAMGYVDGIAGGSSYTNQPQKIVANCVTVVAQGGAHSLFIKTDGSLWAMGDNTSGQLGDAFTDYGYPTSGTSKPEQILPQPQPVLAQSQDGDQQQVTATCLFGSDYRLLTSTNLTLPLSQWTSVCTNSVLYRGTNNFSAIVTNIDSSASQFYILQSL